MFFFSDIYESHFQIHNSFGNAFCPNIFSYVSLVVYQWIFFTLFKWKGRGASRTIYSKYCRQVRKVSQYNWIWLIALLIECLNINLICFISRLIGPLALFVFFSRTNLYEIFERGPQAGHIYINYESCNMNGWATLFLINNHFHSKDQVGSICFVMNQFVL